MKMHNEVMGMVKELSKRLSALSLDGRIKRPGDVDSQGNTLSCDLIETPDCFQMIVDLPGCRLRDVQVAVNGPYLTVSADRRADSDGKEHHAVIVERACGKFERTVELASAVDPDSVQKKLKNGVLNVMVGKIKSDG